MSFKLFAAAIAKHFADMCARGTIVRTAADKVELWELYLKSFPEGTNPLYITNTLHDGSYDRGFVKKLGNLVAVVDGQLVSIWDAPDLPYPYNEVARVLSDYVIGHNIVAGFRHKEHAVGYVETTQRLDDGSIKTWDHFHAIIPSPYFTRNVATELGDIATTVDVSVRAYEGITQESVSTVLSLIDQNALYRGAEFRPAVAKFQSYQDQYLAGSAAAKQALLWGGQDTIGRLKNSAIGTLLVALSENTPLEAAVKSFEAKVAPTNYKRTTSLITPAMVKDAMTTIDEAGLEPALHRRFANMGDLSINNVLWADSAARDVMKEGGIGDILMGEAVAKPKKSSLSDEEIGIEDFIAQVLPKATGMEVLLRNAQQNNLMSLTAPFRDDVPRIFKWGNSFAWSYNGNITDSIKERVKSAGGNVFADLRVSLAWFNGDDLDLHSTTPYGHTYFGNKQGILDVDMNAGGRTSRTPVENQSFNKPMDGKYLFYIHQYCQRDANDVGFVLEVECNGQVTQLSYDKRVSGTIQTVSFTMVQGTLKDLIVVDKHIRHQAMSQMVWNVETEKFVKVNTLMLSPNYWDGEATGNKHWFFILDKCKNPEPARGIYNEFLSPALDKHRKVFEVLGDKTKCQVTDDQLSGLGFSSTQSNRLTVKVTGPKINQTYTVVF